MFKIKLKVVHRSEAIDRQTDKKNVQREVRQGYPERKKLITLKRKSKDENTYIKFGVTRISQKKH